MEFRKLRADEIDARLATVNSKGASVLLYKDARCDMRILDETVGAFNWKREHLRENANCIVSLWDDDKKQWISKEDTGTESNTEAEKGLASDSFKRACFNWGIGRELYTSPFIWFNANEMNIAKGDNGKCKSYDRFTVTDISYDGDSIKSVTVLNESTKVEKTFRNGNRRTETKKVQTITDNQVSQLSKMVMQTNTDLVSFFSYFKVNDLKEFTVDQYKKAVDMLATKLERQEQEAGLPEAMR